MSLSLSGRCLCGTVQYSIVEPPVDAGYCHCRRCQQSSGTPTMAWLTVPFTALTYTGGEPAVYQSSDHSQREFCSDCGTQIAFRRIDVPKTIDITIASLDDPSQVAPQYHIWRQSRIDWFEIDDSLPRYDDAGPDQNQ